MTTAATPQSIAIIGAGITGLTAAYQLQKAGFDVTVFEAAASPGGQIRSTRKDGFLLDCGPHTVLGRGRLPGLINELGLHSRVVEADRSAKKRFMVRYGTPHALPDSPISFLRTPVLSPLGKLRLFAEPFAKKDDASPADKDDESLADFVRRRLGPEVLQFGVDPMVAGTFAGDATKLSARHAFPKLYNLEQTHGSITGGALAAALAKIRHKLTPVPSTDASSDATPRLKLITFDDGAEVLTDQLAAALDGRIECRCEVVSLEQKTLKTTDQTRWVVRYRQTDEKGATRRRQKTVDAVYTTIPTHALAAVEVEAESSDKAKNKAVFAPLDAINYAPVSVVSLGFRRADVRHPLDGFGMLIPREEQRTILGSLFMSTLFPGRAPQDQVLITSFVGGARTPELAGLDADTLFKRVSADLDALLDISGAPTVRAHTFWPRAIPQYEVGYGKFLKYIDQVERDYPGLYVGGSFRDGIAVPDRVTAGYEIVDRIQTHLSPR